MNIHKYPKWQEYIKKNKDKRKAYKSFLFWEKVRNQNYKIELKFNLCADDIKISIQDQYINQKVDKLLVDIGINNDGFDCSIELREKMEFYLMPMNIDIKKVIKMTSSMIKSNNAEKERIPQIVMESLPKIKWFFSLKSIDDVEKYIKENEPASDFTRSTQDVLIQYIETPEELKMFASPSWCTNYNPDQVDDYHEKYKTMYLWVDEGDKIELYGINTHKEMTYIVSIFDSNNNENYSENIRNAFQKAIGVRNHKNNIKTIIYESGIEEQKYIMLLVIINLADDDDLLDAALSLDDNKDIEEIFMSLMAKTFPLIERSKKLMSILRKADKLKDYMIDRVKSKKKLLEVEVNIFLEEIEKNDLLHNEIFMEQYLRSVVFYRKYKIFEKLKMKGVNVYDYIYALGFIDKASPKEFDKVRKNIRNTSKVNILDIVRDCKIKIISNTRLLRLLIKENKMGIDLISHKDYEAINNLLDINLRTKLFKNINKIDPEDISLLMAEKTIDIKQIVHQWLKDKKLSFSNIVQIEGKYINLRMIKDYYSEKDMYDDKSTESFVFKIKYLKMYYKYRHWVKSNDEYENRVQMLLKRNELSEIELSKLFISKNDTIFLKDFNLMKFAIKNESVILTPKVLIKILNEINEKEIEKTNRDCEPDILKLKEKISNILLNKDEFVNVEKYISEHGVANCVQYIIVDKSRYKNINPMLLSYIMKNKSEKDKRSKSNKSDWIYYLDILDTNEDKDFIQHEKNYYKKIYGNILERLFFSCCDAILGKTKLYKVVEEI